MDTGTSLPLYPNSIISWPSGGQTIPAPGLWEIQGIAWSGAGLLDRVEVSTDNGETWRLAKLERPVLPNSFTRFHISWEWDGTEAVIVSRATDTSGRVQPTRPDMDAELGGSITFGHGNARCRLRIHADGSVSSDASSAS